jgi:membrane protease YdiL (CAAX protease family)
LKLPLMRLFQTAASVLAHRLPISENLKILLMEGDMSSKKAGSLFLTAVLLDLIVYVLAAGAAGYFPWLYDMVPSSVLSEGVLVLPLLIFALCTPARFCEMFPFRRIRIPVILLSLLLMAVLLPMMVLCNWLTMLVTSNTAALLSGSITAEPMWLMILIVGVIAPFCEEIAFRGYIFSSFRTTGRIFGSAVLSALLFGLMHMNLNQTCYTFAVGIFWALAVEASGSLWTSVLMHMSFNTVEVLSMYYTLDLQTDGSAGQLANALEGSADMQSSSLMILCIMAAAGVVLAVLLLHAIAALQGRPFGIRRRKNAASPAFQGEPDASASGSDAAVSSAALCNIPLLLGILLSVAYIALSLWLVP